jgi:hypothetical protein
MAIGAGCANAGTPATGAGGGGGDPQAVDAGDTPRDSHINPPHDAPQSSPQDAPASPPIDAPQSSPIDAPPGALFCNADGDCGTGNCCFDLGSPPGFCVAGESLLGVCIPSGS